MTISKEGLEVLKKHRADVRSLRHDKIGNLFDFMQERNLWKANVASILNTSLMTASFAKLVGLTKNGWLKLLSTGLIASVNLLVLHEKYKDEYDKFVAERQEFVNNYWFSKLETSDVVALIEDGLRVITILRDKGESASKLEVHWLALESQSPIHWEQYHINHFWGFVSELRTARKKVKY